MTTKERATIAQYWMNLAVMNRQDLPTNVLSAMLDSIDDLPFEKTYQVFKDWMKTSKLRTYPQPADIREVVLNIADNRQVATDLAHRISKAIRKHGYPWPETFRYERSYRAETFCDAVTHELGSLAWEVIKRRGGWQKLVDDANDSDNTQFIAQLRDQIQSVASQATKGTLDKLPELPMPEKIKELIAACEVKSA